MPSPASHSRSTSRIPNTRTPLNAIGPDLRPALNWALMVACIGLVLGFRSSTNLAAAYGVAVTTTMVITTLLFYVVLRQRFGWRWASAVGLCVPFLAIDLAFFGPNLLKIPAGGWFPLVAGGLVFIIMTTWRTGRAIVAERISGGEVPMHTFLDSLFSSDESPARVPGTAVFLFSVPDVVSPALLANVRHNNVLHERVIVVSIATDPTPRVLPVRRADVRDYGHGVHRVVLHYGLLEQPNVPEGLTEGSAGRLGVLREERTYFLGAESLVATRRPGMALWRAALHRSQPQRHARLVLPWFEPGIDDGRRPAGRTLTALGEHSCDAPAIHSRRPIGPLMGEWMPRNGSTRLQVVGGPGAGDRRQRG